MLKFRVWDKITQRMIYPGETVVDEMGDSFFIMIDQKGFIYEVYDSPLGYYLEENSERYELMRCINSEDKNGKDLYVGDIVRFEHFGEEIKGIIKDHGDEAFVVQITYAYRDIGWGEKVPITFYDYDGRNFIWNALEVIGNIYQNPELIPPDFYEEEN
jgi:uncharacterized phage protein (TIGR01671 family)